MYGEDALVITRVIRMEKSIDAYPYRREAKNKLEALEVKKNPPKPKKQRKSRKKKEETVVEENE